MSAPAVRLALDVRSVLARPVHELRGFTHPDGSPMTPRQAREALVAQLAEGNELLRLGSVAAFDFIKR